MKTKNIISIALTVLLMFSFCSFSSYAADDSNIPITEFAVHGFETYSVVNDDGTTENFESEITVSRKDITSGKFSGFRQFSFPLNTSTSKKIEVQLKLDDDFTITKGHEYNLKFSWGFNINLGSSCRVYLHFFDNDGITIKRQELLLQNKTQNSTVYNVDVNFTPNIDFEQAYRCVLRFEFTQKGYNSGSQSFYISNEIQLIDKDDDTGLINSIISAIKEIPEKIKGFFTELADNIKGFFDSLKNYILYFQDPVILNEEGVLVDENGQPIYINPFENSIEDIEKTFNGWIEDIRNFISNMDESRVQVSGYLQTGTGLINDILGASPIISAVLVFIASFFVIRKVVGR